MDQGGALIQGRVRLQVDMHALLLQGRSQSLIGLAEQILRANGGIMGQAGDAQGADWPLAG